MGRKYKNKQNQQNEQQNEDLNFERIILEPKTQNQKTYLNSIRTNTITLCTGPAGCGKTLIPVGYALQNITYRSTYKKLIIIRSVREACGEELGFLPGSVDEKMYVWLMPIIDNLKVIIPYGKIEYLIKNKQIEALPIAYSRGRSLSDCFVILDEAQNCTKKQILTILTRIGQNTKLVINGDITQTDLKDGCTSGLADAMSRLSGMANVANVYLNNDDIVRNTMIGEILKRFQ